MGNVKRIKNIINIKEYIIYFSYETWKGHLREQERTLNALDKPSAKEIFKSWAKEQRSMVNAKILTIAETENNYNIEL